MFQLFNLGRLSLSLDARGVAQIRDQTEQSMRRARHQVLRGRGIKVDEYSRIDRRRARDFIANIPGLIPAAYKTYHRQGGRLPNSDFDCEIGLMRLRDWETCEDSGSFAFHRADQTEAADPGKLRHAAKLVFAFCQGAGYNPIVVCRPFKELAPMIWNGCFEIRLRLNIPDELKLPLETSGPLG